MENDNIHGFSASGTLTFRKLYISIIKFHLTKIEKEENQKKDSRYDVGELNTKLTSLRKKDETVPLPFIAPDSIFQSDPE